MKTKKNRQRIAWILTAALLVMALVGCGSSGGNEAGEEQEEYSIVLYYVNDAYVETGDESLEPLVVTEGTLNIESSLIEERYQQTLELLSQPVDGADTMFRQGMVHGVTVSDGLAVVDFDSNMMYGGSMEESFLIEQVVRTLIKSFDDVERVAFTVDGEEVDSLMGHLEANCTYGLIAVEEDGTEVELVSIVE